MTQTTDSRKQSSSSVKRLRIAPLFGALLASTVVLTVIPATVSEADTDWTATAKRTDGELVLSEDAMWSGQIDRNGEVQSIEPVNQASRAGRTAPRATTGTTVHYQVDRAGNIKNRMIVGTEPNRSIRNKIEWSVSRDAVALNWGSDRKVDNWIVKKNDRVVARGLAATQWVDTTAPATDQPTRYTVEGSAKVQTKDHGVQEQPYFYDLSLPPFDSSAIGTPFSESLVQDVAVNSDVGRRQKIRETMLSYRAFISANRVPAPWYCGNTVPQGIATFGGDNRSWSRSLADKNGKARVQWNARVASDGFSEFFKIVNPTTGYDAKGKVVGTWQESPNTVTSRLGESSAAVQRYRYFIKNSRNLGCATAPGIDSNVSFAMASDGYQTLDGAHDGAPSHEIIAAHNPDIENGSLKQGCPYRRALVDFAHLQSPPFPQQRIYVKWAGTAIRPC